MRYVDGGGTGPSEPSVDEDDVEKDDLLLLTDPDRLRVGDDCCCNTASRSLSLDLAAVSCFSSSQ